MNRSQRRKETKLAQKEYKHVGYLEDWFINCLFSEKVTLDYRTLHHAFALDWRNAAIRYNKGIRKSYEPQIDENYLETAYKPLENEKRD